MVFALKQVVIKLNLVKRIENDSCKHFSNEVNNNELFTNFLKRHAMAYDINTDCQYLVIKYNTWIITFSLLAKKLNTIKSKVLKKIFGQRYITVILVVVTD